VIELCARGDDGAGELVGGGVERRRDRGRERLPQPLVAYEDEASREPQTRGRARDGGDHVLVGADLPAERLDQVRIDERVGRKSARFQFELNDRRRDDLDVAFLDELPGARAHGVGGASAEPHVRALGRGEVRDEEPLAGELARRPALPLGGRGGDEDREATDQQRAGNRAPLRIRHAVKIFAGSPRG
jgi:hypothetical protein